MKFIARLDEINGLPAHSEALRDWIADALRDDRDEIETWFRSEHVFREVIEAIAAGRVAPVTLRAFRQAFDHPESSSEVEAFLRSMIQLRAMRTSFTPDEFSERMWVATQPLHAKYPSAEALIDGGEL